jgi:hypothetical protein
MVKTESYQRKPFFVEGVQVTDENLEAVADWCGGEIRTQHTMSDGDKRYIKVRVHHPISERQTKAYAGDWVLFSGNGYKVYTDAAFVKTFIHYDADAVDVHDPNQEVLVEV